MNIQGLPAPSANAQNTDWFDSNIIGRDLGRRSFQGFSVTFGVQALKFVVNFGGTAVLARLVTPTDFGLIAMVASVTGVAYVLNDLGLSLAVIQRPRLNHRELSCIFWLGLAIGLITALAVAAAGPLLAAFFKDSRLTAISPVIALSFLFAALGGQHQALLRRHMCFGVIGTIELASGLFGFAVAIVLAFIGYGYWSIVLQQVCAFGFIAAASWLACDWRPGRIFWEPTAKAMIGFGGNVTGSNLLSYICRNLDNVLIGRFCGATSLGLYTKAYQLLLLPIWQINIPMLSVMTPALSRLQFEPQRFKRLYLRSIMAIVSIGMPLVVFMFVRAEQIILVSLGKTWIGAVLLFRLLAPAAFMDTFNIAAGLIFNTLGQTERQLRLSVVSAAAIIVGICIGIVWGAAGVAIGVTVATCLIRIPAYAYVYAESPVRLTNLISVLWRPAACSLLAGLILFFVPSNTYASTWALIFLLLRDACIFVACFAVAWVALPNGLGILREVVGLISDLFRARAPGSEVNTRCV